MKSGAYTRYPQIYEFVVDLLVHSCKRCAIYSPIQLNEARDLNLFDMDHDIYNGPRKFMTPGVSVHCI